MNWPNNAQSPVLFYIDDLCNKWIDIKGDGRLTPENDWGYGGLDPNGVYRFLEREILSVNPEIKVTFFVLAGERAPIIINSLIKSYSYPMNFDQKSKEFFSYIYNETHHELAYHGLTHGIPGEKSKDFIQEWESYKDLNEAIKIINKGKELFKDAVGQYPRGGKYCGYQSNEFSDESISRTGFEWWCRYYNKGIESALDPNFTGVDKNSLTNYQSKLFGNRSVVDIPTTIPGNLFNKSKTKNPLKRIKILINKKQILEEKLSEIDYLLENNLILSIQEHISPSRVDGRRQTPNIFDDKESLKMMFHYLKDKDVWYCTGSELANWMINTWMLIL